MSISPNRHLSKTSNVMEDHKKEIDADFIVVERKNMRRWKPQQEIYKPGSGKLRRSNQGADDTASESGSTRNLRSEFVSTDDLRGKSDLHTDFGANRELQRRAKKPEREYYVPRVVAQAKEQLSPQNPQIIYDQDPVVLNGSENRVYNDKMNNSKRYSSNRSHGDNGSRGNSQNEWRDKSPNRNYRMGSEPRDSFSNGSNWNRDRDRDRHRERDTRSVEPTGMGHRNTNPDGGKIQAKPPSGRRHSTTGNYQNIKNLENLPPRLRKKYLEENGLTDDVRWDGSSSVYQQTAPQQHHQQNPVYQSTDAYSTLPHATAPPVYNSNVNLGYHTLPGRPRGRGRFHNQEPEFQPGPVFRFVSPDRASMPRSPVNSRPGTPTRRFDNRPPSRPPSRSQTPLSHYDDNRYTNDAWGDMGGRGGGKPISFDRSGGRASEPRHLDRERDRQNNDTNWQHRDEDHRNRGVEYHKNRRNEPGRRGDGDRGRLDKDGDKKDHNRRNDRKKRGGKRDIYAVLEKNSSSRDFIRQDTKESSFSNESNRTFTGENLNANRVPQLETQPGDVKEKHQLQQPTKSVSNNNSSSTLVDTNLNSEIETTAAEKNQDPIAERHGEERDILDWNEEVELDHRLEAEAFSDALTRSSSMASLQDISTRSMPSSTATTPNTKKKRKSGRRKSKQRSDSSCRDKTPTNKDRTDSFASVESREHFKVPHDPGTGRHGRRRRRSSKEHRDTSFDRFHNKSRGPSRDVSFDRPQAASSENWRDEIIRSRQNSEREGSVLSCRVSSDRSRKNSELEDHLANTQSKKGGILVLPSKSPEPPQSNAERPKFPEIRKAPAHQKTLFDPKNPNKPILVKSPGGRVSAPGFSENNSEAPKIYMADSSGKLVPTWYNESSDEFKSCHFRELLRDIKRADLELQYIMNNGLLLVNYETVDNLRQFLKSGLEYLLCKAIKFCQTENVEQHIWKILYYNIIEVTRKAITDDPDNKQQYKGFLLYLIDEGTKYFERLIGILEDTYNFKVINYIGNNSMVQHKGLRFTGLALVSAQKIFLFLGDLGRYREQVNETSNYGKCRLWYIKSHEINPKNGKPYNQLAVLAVYSRRKLDAVYYYMRSLMSSNPVPSARECLISLFDENRKKYEQGEKKRREERLERQRQHMKQKESEENGTPNFLRKETWIRPDGRRLHRTTKALQEDVRDSEEEDLASLSSVDVNKRFVTSYLHVHGKLITKIGMESFQDAAMQMLKEFRALLQHSPVSLPCNRFLQLLALNMFAIESTQLKDPNLQQSASYRSELQERALIVSLQMFNLILERCVSILQDHFNAFVNQEKPGSPLDSLPHDANVLLPAVKVWCDWMLCHTAVWNPPPSTHDFKVGPSGDLWSRLGLLMNILEQMDQDSSEVFVNEPKEGFEPVRLPEDATLCGFTPLIFHDREASFAPQAIESETAQLRLRIAKLLFFGTVYLCGLEPPVLKLEIEDGRRDYVSVVCVDSGQDSPRDEAVLTKGDEVLLETFSGDEEDTSSEKPESKTLSASSEASSEVKDLLTRKLELEKTNRSQELHRQRVMKILSQSVVSVHLEIRPKYLVPDTNCFIDHLHTIQTVAKSHTYTLMVPIVVLSELEGLSKGTPSPTSRGKFAPSPEHVQRVAVASRLALEFLKKRHAAVKCVTTKGAVLASTSFSTEDDATWDATMKNDDKILTTCLVLCKTHGKEQQPDVKEGEPRHLFREVVLLTEDRNLRVKAHARDVPVRALPDFMRWAGLGG